MGAQRRVCTYHHVAPLVEPDGQVSVRLHPLRIRRIHDCFTGRTNGNGFCQLCFARSCNPSNLWGKVGHVRLLRLQGALGHEHGEVAVLHAQLLDLGVEEVLDGLPDGKGPGTEDVAATHIVVFNHF